MPHITAIIPAYNEEQTIGSVVIRTGDYVDHIIVVDDGSSDSTAEIAERAGAEVIKHLQNKGKGAALKTGFNAVKDTDVVVTMDSDGQHDPGEIPKLIIPIEKGEADVVNGSRYLVKKHNGTPKYRRIGQKFLDRTTNLNTGLKITDSQSGLRAFASYTIPAFRFSQSGFTIESEMLMDATAHNFKVIEVPIEVSYLKNNKSSIHTKNPFRHGLGVFVRILQDMEFRRPLYYFTLPGVVMIIIGLVLGLNYFGMYLDQHVTSLLPTVLAGMIGLGGIFIAFTGIILHSMAGMIRENMGLNK